jgi:hypothetical protein
VVKTDSQKTPVKLLDAKNMREAKRSCGGMRDAARTEAARRRATAIATRTTGEKTGLKSGRRMAAVRPSRPEQTAAVTARPWPRQVHREQVLVKTSACREECNESKN